MKMQHFDMESTLFVRGGSLLYISIKKAFLTFWHFFLYHPFCDRQHEIRRHLVWKVPSNFQLIKEGTSWKFEGASCKRHLRFFCSVKKAQSRFRFRFEKKTNRNLLRSFFAEQKIRRRLLHEAPSNFWPLSEIWLRNSDFGILVCNHLYTNF